MGTSRKQVLKRLQAAREERQLVLIEREIDYDELEGYVLDVGTEWLLLALLDPGIVLDGYAFIRLADVRRVRGRNSAEMVQRALSIREQWPPTAPDLTYDLSGTRELLISLSQVPLVTIHPEENDPDVVFVGAPVGVDERAVRLVEVTPRAVWNARPTKHRLNAITRVEVGGRYEQALLSVAGPPPSLELQE